MQCTLCGKEFEAKRSTARFCSAKCRVAHNRLSVTKSVTINPVSVTKDSVTPLSVTEQNANTVRVTTKRRVISSTLEIGTIPKLNKHPLTWCNKHGVWNTSCGCK